MLVLNLFTKEYAPTLALRIEDIAAYTLFARFHRYDLNGFSATFCNVYLVYFRDWLDTCLVSIPVSVFVSFVPPIPAPILCAWYRDTAAGIDTSAGIDTATSIDTTVGVNSTQVAGILLI